MHDEQFFTWPPSPQLALAVFPYIRSVYYNLYKELVLPYETRMNRQLLGLPPVPPRPEPANDGNQNNPNAARNAAHAQGGIVGILQTLIDALDQEEADGHPQADEFQLDFRGEEGHGEGDGEDAIMLEVIVEELDMNEAAGDEINEGAPEAAPGEAPAGEVGEAGQVIADDAAGDAGDAANAPADDAAPAPVVPLAAQPALNAAADAAADAPAGNHEAPPAPARRMGLGAILSNVSNAIVSALILPGVSFAAGEALRLVLPKEWTTSSRSNPWMRSSTAAGSGRPGLFQQQWGRSLVGGCLFIVLRDMLRVYTKTRKVAALSNRRVKNVDRPRRLKK